MMVQGSGIGLSPSVDYAARTGYGRLDLCEHYVAVAVDAQECESREIVKTANRRVEGLKLCEAFVGAAERKRCWVRASEGPGRTDLDSPRDLVPIISAGAGRCVDQLLGCDRCRRGIASAC